MCAEFPTHEQLCWGRACNGVWGGSVMKQEPANLTFQRTKSGSLHSLLEYLRSSFNLAIGGGVIRGSQYVFDVERFQTLD